MGIKANKYLNPYENAVFCKTIIESNGNIYTRNKMPDNKNLLFNKNIRKNIDDKNKIGAKYSKPNSSLNKIILILFKTNKIFSKNISSSKNLK